MAKIKSIEEKAKAYDNVVGKLKRFMAQGVDPLITRADVQDFFPEVKESEDERIRKGLIEFFKDWSKTRSHCWSIYIPDILAWLEKRGKETSWKPSKEEMDVLYSLAYITNQYDEHKEEVVTRLYQDLKREFFNGSSYENMFPNTEDGVRRRSTIQVLEYARCLDTYNQYGKADIDKNIAWLEEQNKKDSQVICPTFTFDDILALQCCMETAKKVQKDKDLYEKLNDLHGRVYDVYQLEKQGKQILANSAKTCKDKQNSAWSEEDEYEYNHILKILKLEATTEQGNKGYNNSTGSVNWFKSLKERYTWKPNDEQMEQLHNVFNNISAGWEDSVIESLYNDLKKLREE